MENNPPLRIVKALYEEGGLSPEQLTHMVEVKPEEELYDLMNDPHEFTNLADSPEHHETLLFMRKLVEQWVEETGDMGQFREKREDALETQWFNYDEVYKNN